MTFFPPSSTPITPSVLSDVVKAMTKAWALNTKAWAQLSRLKSHVKRFYSAGYFYPTPDIADVLQKVGRVRYISCFDAKRW